MAASVQERLKLKRITLDTWSTDEKLTLASGVPRTGDQNWSCVSRYIKSLAEANRPADWFSPKNCAQQYASLLENVETPKRKKRSVGFTDKIEMDTPGESISKKLAAERIDELKKLMAEDEKVYHKEYDDIYAIICGEAEDRIAEFVRELDEEEVQKEREKEAHVKWLKEREERRLELERAWKPGVHLSSHFRRTSSLSEQSSDADSPLNEPLNVDVPEEALAPKPTPTSPLLTSLLKSPASLPPPSSSILHSAITSPMRGVSPTIANLLNSSPVNLINPLGMSAANQSPNLKHLVSMSIGGCQMEDIKPVLPPTPSQGAPTLSMLLELPPSMPGKPLPMIQPPAPPPYSDHLGPPPPYSLATEYLQKQKAEQAAQAQFVSNHQKLQQPLPVVQVSVPIPQPAPTPLPEPDVPQLNAEFIPSYKMKVEKPEQAEPDFIPITKELTVLAHNTSDHDYVDVQPEVVQASEVAITEPEPVVPSSPEKPTAIAAVIKVKTEKKAELDVFEFDEQEEVSRDVEDAKQSYLKRNAQRLAKKEAEASIRAESLRKSTETCIIEDEGEKVVPVEKHELPVEVPTIKAKLEPVTIDDVEVPMAVVESELEDSSVVENNSAIINEVQTEVNAVAPDPPVKAEREENCLVLGKEEEDPDLHRSEQPLPHNSLLDLSTTEDEKSNEAPARSLVKKRRGTLTDSVPNSPNPVTEEEREHKAWKKKVLPNLKSIMGHKSASLFLKPITDDQAPGYSTTVLRPMDLSTLKRNIEAGIIRTNDEFQRDVKLIFFNAAMFNKKDSVVYQISADMEKDIMDMNQMWLQATGGSQPSRRETRTQDKGEGKTRTLRHSTKIESKRKRTDSTERARKKIKVEDG